MSELITAIVLQLKSGILKIYWSVYQFKWNYIELVVNVLREF